LDQQRAGLRRALDVERALHPEVCARVVDLVDLGELGVDPARAVAGHRVVLPAVPELGDDIDELVRPVVATAVGGPFGAEVADFRLARGGHDVPSRPAAADVVQRGELPGDVKRLVVRRRDRRDEPDVLGDGGEGRQEGQRFEPAQRVVPDVALQRQAVGQEHRIEPAPLGDLGKVLEMPDVGQPPRVGAGMTPGRLVVPHAHQEGVEVQFPGQMVLHVEMAAFQEEAVSPGNASPWTPWIKNSP
jgi:hypothetical protein